MEQGGIPPDLAEALLSYIPGFDIQIATALHPAAMGDEAKAGASQTAPCQRVHAAVSACEFWVLGR